MNIKTTKTCYLGRACRTLENVIIEDIESGKQKVMYIYNYEGVHFRLFEDWENAKNFLKGNPAKILKEYLREKSFDNFLIKYKQ